MQSICVVYALNRHLPYEKRKASIWQIKFLLKPFLLYLRVIISIKLTTFIKLIKMMVI
jgi:hypothetical protein